MAYNLACQLTDGNISTWGKCLTDTVFFGEPLLGSIVVLAFFAVFAYRNNIPGIVVLPFGVLLMLGMYLGGTTAMFVLYAAGIVLMLAWMALILIQRFLMMG